LLNIIFHESWFQDQFLDILSKNIKTQYFSNVLEVKIFEIFNSILENINRNDNVIITISIFKNNSNYFEELFKDLFDNLNMGGDIYKSNNNNYVAISNTSLTISHEISRVFMESLSNENIILNAEKKNEESLNEFKNIRASYLIDIENEKKILDEKEKEYTEKKNKDREENYNRMISQNIQSKISSELDNDSIKNIMHFFNNIDTSIDDNSDNNEGSIIINGEQYNQMIINTICNCIKEMLEKPDSTKQILEIILKRFDFILKEVINVLQNNGLIKNILLRILKKNDFIFLLIRDGIQDAINKKIELTSKIKAIKNEHVTKDDFKNDYVFFKSIVDFIIIRLTANLELIRPSKENNNDTSDLLVGGNNKLNILNKRNTLHKEKNKLKNKKTLKKSKGWFW
jgi:hypothetical protein